MKRRRQHQSLADVPCMRCGREASEGRSVTLELGQYRSWAWLGLFLGFFKGLLLLAAARKQPREFSYSLCPRCIRIRRIKQIVAGAFWIIFVGTLASAIMTGNWELWGTIAFWGFFVAVFASASSSLRLIREKALYGPYAR